MCFVDNTDRHQHNTSTELGTVKNIHFNIGLLNFYRAVLATATDQGVLNFKFRNKAYRVGIVVTDKQNESMQIYLALIFVVSTQVVVMQFTITTKMNLLRRLLSQVFIHGICESTQPLI